MKVSELDGPIEIRDWNEYLVKPRKAHEDEVSRYILGYLTALRDKHYFAQDELQILGNFRQLAEAWAHEYLDHNYSPLRRFIRQKIEETL